jgi:hypothetical protein
MRKSLQILVFCALLLADHLLAASPATTTTTKAPQKRYPVRTFLGNMYHRFRNNRTPLVLIPTVLRLAYQYGGPLLDRMSSAFGSGGGQAAAAAAGGAAAPALESFVESAIQGAMGGAGAASAPMAGLPFGAGLPPGFAAPLGFGGGIRPVFLRRRRR